MKYLPLFSVKLEHLYYTNGRCPDFQILPTVETKRLLKNQRSVLKTKPDGVQVLTAVNNDNTPFIPLPETAVFRFHLYLQNQQFPLFTDLSEITQQLAPVYTNQNSEVEESQLTLTSQRHFVTEQFISENPSAKEIFTLSGKPLRGQKEKAFKLLGKDIPQFPVHYEETTKQITVNTNSVAPKTQFTVKYLIMSQQQRNTFATVEIKLPIDKDHKELPSKGLHFQVKFSPKQMRWRYFVVVDKSDVQYKIEDKADQPRKFGVENHTAPTEENQDGADKIAKSLADKYPQKQRFRFISDTLIPCHQKPIKGLQLCLVRTDNGHQTVEPIVGDLPNPPLTNFAVSKTDQSEAPQKEDFLFQIIKYFNQDSIIGGI